MSYCLYGKLFGGTKRLCHFLLDYCTAVGRVRKRAPDTHAYMDTHRDSERDLVGKVEREGGRGIEGGRDHKRRADLDQCEWYVVDLPLEHAHTKNNYSYRHTYRKLAPLNNQ